MILLSKLVLAHLLGDFVFQPSAWVIDKKLKKQRSKKLYAHALLHGLLTFLIVADFTFWLPVTIITISHFFIDVAKVKFEKPEKKILWFLADQGLHFVVLGLIAYGWQQPDWSWQHIDARNFLLLSTAVVFLTNPSSVIIKLIISQWTPDTLYNVKTSLPDAGKFIGFLERLFVLTFVLTNHWEAVGFLLAAKSVFRFGDLKESRDRKLTEYVLIGTFLSFGIALLAALGVSALMTRGA